jgi:hypothetical protein
MENLEKNTAYWREMCELQKQEPLLLTTNRHSLQQQLDIRSRNESIVESVDETNS